MPRVAYLNTRLKSRVWQIDRRLERMRAQDVTFDHDLIDLSTHSLRRALQFSKQCAVSQAFGGHTVIAAPQALLGAALRLCAPSNPTRIVVLPSRDTEFLAALVFESYARSHPDGFEATIARARNVRRYRRGRSFLARRRHTVMICRPKADQRRVILVGTNCTGDLAGAGDPQGWPRAMLHTIDAVTMDVLVVESLRQAPAGPSLPTATVLSEPRFATAWRNWTGAIAPRRIAI